jgi:hypothetical protein
VRACGGVRFAGRRVACRNRNSQSAISTISGCRIWHPARNSSDAARVLDLLAALSRRTNFSVGCYCENDVQLSRSLPTERHLVAAPGHVPW